MKSLFLYILILFLIIGCAAQKAYVGKDRKTTELSTIKPTLGVIINKVDEYWLDKLKSGSFLTLPGEHSITVSVPLGPNFGYKSSPMVELIFSTEPGKIYIVDYKGSVDSNGKYVVIEKGSGKILLEK